jgi:hypothetical protein
MGTDSKVSSQRGSLMASYLDGFSHGDLATLAGIIGADPAAVSDGLRRRPWSINDLLGDPAVVDAVLARQEKPTTAVSPFLLFAVLVHRVADELREATYVSDWSGPRSRLPVFDVVPLQEFLEDPGREIFLATLLASFALPEPPPVPADPFDLTDLARWVDQALPADRIQLLRRLGDLSLLMAGVFPDHNGPKPLRPIDAERLGRTVGMRPEELLELCDHARLAPGLDALESLGARWYGAAASGGAPPVLNAVATRFRSARRVLNHLTDRYLYRIEPGWNLAA